MSTYDDLRAETLALFAPVTTAAETANADETARRLSDAHDRLADGELTVVVCGEFKRGKSTLLNALLHEREELLPTDTLYATRLVTTVSYGETEQITVTLEGADGVPERKEISRADVAKYVTESGNPGNVERALLLEITSPSPRLRSGVRWVDTPGVGGVFAEHTAVTMGFLPSADALIFVSDVTQPLTESELTFLRSASTAAKVVDDTDGSIFVLTKVDLVADYQTFVDSFAAKAAEATGRKRDEVTVVPVSAHAQQEYLTGGDEADRELGNFDALETALWTVLNRRRATLLLGGALTALDDAAAALLVPIETATESLRRTTDEELETFRTEIEARRRRVAELPKDQARWRGELKEEVSVLAGTLKRRASAGLDEVWQRFNTDYVFQERFLDQPDQLIGQLSSDVAVVVGAVNELADREAARILAEFAASSSLELRNPRFPALPYPSVPSVAVTGSLGEADRPSSDVRRMRETTFGAGTGGAVGAGAGAGIGALIGTFIFPGLGTAAGATIGGWIGSAVGVTAGAATTWKHSGEEAKKRDREARRRSIKTELGGLRREQDRHLDEAIAALRVELVKSITAELESRIAQEKESIDSAVRRLRRSQAGTEQEAAQRLAELEAERAPLDATREAVARLADQAAALAGPSRTPGDTGTGAGAGTGAGTGAGSSGRGRAGAAGDRS